MSKRFSAVLDPCSAYFVWDSANGGPVMVSGDIAAFGTKVEAHRTAAVLNRQSTSGMDKHIVRLRRILIQANHI